jgi:hypothetical protein
VDREHTKHSTFKFRPFTKISLKGILHIR